MKKDNIKIEFFILFTVFFIYLQGICTGIETGEKEAIAILPLKNYSGNRHAIETIYPLIEKKLKEKGYIILDSESIKKFLLKNKIREKGYISSETGKRLFDEYRVNAILTGSINTFSQLNNPEVGICLRLIDPLNNSIIWAEHGAITNNDFRSIFGEIIKKDLNELSQILLDRLFDSFNIKRIKNSHKRHYRVGIIPFHNLTNIRNIGIITTYIFIEKIFKYTDLEPVEFGDTKNVIANLKIYPKGEIDLKRAIEMANTLGLDGIIVGSVESLNHAANPDSVHEVEISARLIDAHKGKIVWYGYSHFKGDEKMTILDFGKIRSIEAVLGEALVKLTEDLERKLVKQNILTKYSTDN